MRLLWFDGISTERSELGVAKFHRALDRDIYPALIRRGIASLQMGKAYDFAFNFNVDNSPADPNDPATPVDSKKVLNSVDVTETESWI